jgi:hypothetical protein
VAQVIDKMLESEENVRVLQHLLSYSEIQYGDRIQRTVSKNWDVEIDLIYQIYKRIIGIYANNQSMSMIVRNKAMLPYMEKVLELLAPWSILIDSDDLIRFISLSIDKVNHLLLLLSGAERSLACVYMHGCKFTLAESHCKRALSYASRYKGEAVHKTALSFRLLFFLQRLLFLGKFHIYEFGRRANVGTKFRGYGLQAMSDFNIK